MTDDRVQALQRALEHSPEDHVLRALYADTLADLGRFTEATQEYARLHEQGRLLRGSLLKGAQAAIEVDDLKLAEQLTHGAERAGLVEGVADVRKRLNSRLAQEGVTRLRLHAGEGQADGGPGLHAEPTATFADIGGLEDVKKVVNRTIILPFRRPELYQRFARKAGGGVLLYGPPGVGKTLIARATAGECGLPFFNVRIEDVVDMWYGNTEQNLHEAFEQARASAPCVLFLDELDALGHARSKIIGAGRQVVDQLLQELDAIGASNAGLLVLAATNTPWDVDDALKRPGRFDRVLFVPPPDEAARIKILDVLLRGMPLAGVETVQLARETPLFSGADLRALVEAAADLAIDETLESGADVPISGAHFERALKAMRPTTLAWLQTASTYVQFADRGRQYEEVERFLESGEARKRRR